MSSVSPAIHHWLTQQLPNETWSLKALTGDASFRHYYRVSLPDRSHILMIAPPEKEKTKEFIQIAQALAPLGLQVPHIYAYEPQQGLALLSDLGDSLLLDVLNAQTVEAHYTKAMEALLVLQGSNHTVPSFDASHAQLELSYFPDWFLDQLLGMDLSHSDQAVIEDVNTYLVQNVLAQPQVFVHRDYHSRNLMLLPNDELGIIDFQDAMKGPITYDLVSLLKDCYITWPQEKVQAWAGQFWKMRSLSCSVDTFYEWFDLTGLQRHLKVLGVFSRLKIRDHKPHYVKDMPRILNYVLGVTSQYPALADFHEFCQRSVVPTLQGYFDQHAIETDVKVA